MCHQNKAISKASWYVNPICSHWARSWSSINVILVIVLLGTLLPAQSLVAEQSTEVTSNIHPKELARVSSKVTGIGSDSGKLTVLHSGDDWSNAQSILRQPSVTTPALVTTIVIKSDGFTPKTITIPVNTVITWHNTTEQTHLLQSGQPTLIYLPLVVRGNDLVSSSDSARDVTPAESENFRSDGSFRATLLPGATFSVTFNTVGTYPFYLATAPHLQGSVIVKASELPPDPASVASSIDPSVATDIASATEFLYTGSDPIQTGVLSGSMEITRVAIVRGYVLDQNGEALSGVQVDVLEHPQFGQTLTRSDGMFDMAVNGGGWLTFNYRKNGYLPVQRKVDVPWRDFTWLPEVVLIRVDPNVSAINLASNQMQVVRGSLITDTDGTRQAILLIPPNTQATLVFAGGVTQTLTTFHARITEYTVGERGAQAMPGELPAQSGYTYAAEYSVDEAVAAGALNVSFSQPLIHYSQNFLNFPIGIPVPAGYYDRLKSQWVASENGRVVKVLRIVNGLADLDTDGDGNVDNGALITPTMVLTPTLAERQTLAQFAQPDQSFWRVPIRHFSSYDHNWPYGLPDDAVPPDQPKPEPDDILDDPNQECGSLIGCENQVLGETLDVVGTPFRLHYSSDRSLGRSAVRSLRIFLSGDTIPASLKRIELSIQVAGRSVSSSFAATPHQSTVFTWDGRDAYGRFLQGEQPIFMSIGYVYDAVYRSPTQKIQAFSQYGSSVMDIPSRMEAVLLQQWQGRLGGWDARGQGLGGWSLNVHHTYNPSLHVLLLGNGERRVSNPLQEAVIKTVAGGWPNFGAFYGMAVAPDNSYYLADYSNNRIRHISIDGTITTVAGSGAWGTGGDGGPAIEAQLGRPAGVALGNDGSFYIADTETGRIRRVDPQGIISTIAGGGTRPEGLADGIPATQAYIARPNVVTVAADGSIYFGDYGSDHWRVRRVDPSGMISTIAGGGNPADYVGDGGLATDANLYNVTGLAVGAEGNIYIADGSSSRVRRVDSSGIITTVAGNGNHTFTGDGGPARETALNAPMGLAIDKDGSLYIADTNNLRVRRVDPQGIITTVAGKGLGGYTGDSGPATGAQVRGVTAIGVGREGSLYVADSGNSVIRQVERALPGFGLQDILIAAEDGSELYVFSSSGRHLRTIDGLTGALRYQFGYDNRGHLAQIIDGDNNTTTIEHDANGNPSAIIAPYGQRTILTTDANRYLASVSNPAGEVVRLTANADGLLTAMTDPRGNTYHYTYDALGRLTLDEDPLDGSKSLSRVGSSRSYTVTVTTAMGRKNVYVYERLATGSVHRAKIDWSGNRIDSLISPDGSRQITYPDGTVDTIVLGPDPRWGMVAPIITSFTRRLPSGLTQNVTNQQTVSLSEPKNPLSLQTINEQFNFNGRLATVSYESVSRTITLTTPAGRTSTETLDVQSRIVQQQIADFYPFAYSYDARGRLISASAGISSSLRTVGLTYNGAGLLNSILDPLNRTLSFQYDLGGRITQQTQPDSRIIAFAYDANNNVTALTPPGKPAHTFAYSAVDLVNSYTPPNVGIGNTQTNYSYNADRQLTQVTRPDGQMIDLGYDKAGRLSTLTLQRGQLQYAYDPHRGNLITITAPGGVNLGYGYDGALLTSERWAGLIQGIVTRTYNSDFRILARTVNDAAPIPFGYDNDGLLVQAGELTLNRSSQNGLITGAALGNVSDVRSYNRFSEITSYSATVGNTPLFARQYARDALGRITQVTEAVSGTTTVYGYGYDLAGQLTTVTQNGASIAQYSYDSNGNRLSLTTPNGTVTGSYDAQDRLLQYGATTYTYTANGELSSKTTAGQTTTYQYDELGNLTHVSLPDGTMIDYVIDGQNRRIGKKVNGALVQGFLYQDQLKPIAELDGAGNIVSRFVYATHENVPEYLIKGGIIYRILTDQLGSPRLVINVTTGEVVQRMDYDAFGTVTQDTKPGFQPFGFAGGLYDQYTNLVRFGFRDYDANKGRWITKDPIMFAGNETGIYIYSKNNPVMYIDPLGLECFNFWENVKWRFETTNKFLPGLFAPGIGPIGIGLLTSGSVANTIGTLSLGQAIHFIRVSWGEGWIGVYGAEVTTSVLTTSAVNFVATGVAWELGVGIGSIIGAAIDWQLDASWGPSDPSCKCK